MYHPSIACGAHEARLSGGSKMSAFVPRGAIDVRLKSKSPSSTSNAALLGLVREARNKFKVISHCASNSHHSCSGKFLLTVASPAMKWFLKVWIALLAALTR